VRLPEFEAVIGLEVHAQLSTQTKLFCGCHASYGGEPNTRVCPVCLGLPGALPVVNAKAVEFAVRMGLATGCTIAPRSIFARKNYFYPDCPKNYQISQYDTPLCSDGVVAVGDGGRPIRINRIHLEEDAGKLIHDHGGDHSYVDMNRCGVPLIEIVSEPDIRTPAEAREYMQQLRSILRYLGICDGNMEEGSLRCDANVSVREVGSDALGVKTEVKNVNSFKFVEQALAFEINRQTRVVEGGGEVSQETLLWDAERGEARIMRSKEEARDYRYFPEPDLLVLRADDSLVRSIAGTLPELPDARRDRFVSQFGLPSYDAGVLTATREFADYFEAVTKLTSDAKVASNWVMGEVLRELNERAVDIDAFEVTPGRLAELIAMVASGGINTPTARDVFREMSATGRAAAEIVSAKGLEQITDDGAIREAASRVIDDNPDALDKYLRGEDKILKFFVGQLMKATRGKANPQQAQAIVKALLDARRNQL
jgi:aspartyl-tRNA(Asn)/glutamyl-tRNA(Gln) amidotransferase subunit B